MRFTGKVCIVSGAGSGIGRAAAERFGKEGGKVVVADIDDKGGNETVKAITDGGGEAAFVHCDVESSQDVQKAIKTAVDKWGKVDVVVNDAAMMTFEKIVDLPEEKWDKVMSVNLKSVFLFSKYSLPHMPKGGAFVNISSVHAFETEATVVPYATTKGGMNAFIRGFALECEEKKVRVNGVAPGAVDTPMLWDNPNVKSGKEKIKGAVGEPADLAAVICFLASDEARFVNGTVVVVDGARLDIL